MNDTVLHHITLPNSVHDYCDFFLQVFALGAHAEPCVYGVSMSWELCKCIEIALEVAFFEALSLRLPVVPRLSPRSK